MFKWIFILVCGVIVLSAGCAKQQQFTAIERICVPEANKAEVMETAEAVLGEMLFAVSKFDAESGFIRTRPLSSAQFFEFWRKDTIGEFNQAEANAHSVRRTVDLTVGRQGGQVCVECNAKVERLSLSNQEDTKGRTQKYDKFSGMRFSTQKIELVAEQKSWLDLGRDARLETEILKRIEKKQRSKEAAKQSITKYK